MPNWNVLVSPAFAATTVNGARAGIDSIERVRQVGIAKKLPGCGTEINRIQEQTRTERTNRRHGSGRTDIETDECVAAVRDGMSGLSMSGLRCYGQCRKSEKCKRRFAEVTYENSP